MADSGPSQCRPGFVALCKLKIITSTSQAANYSRVPLQVPGTLKCGHSEQMWPPQVNKMEIDGNQNLSSRDSPIFSVLCLLIVTHLTRGRNLSWSPRVNHWPFIVWADPLSPAVIVTKYPSLIDPISMARWWNTVDHPRSHPPNGSVLDMR